MVKEYQPSNGKEMPDLNSREYQDILADLIDRFKGIKSEVEKARLIHWANLEISNPENNENAKEALREFVDTSLGQLSEYGLEVLEMMEEQEGQRE